MQHVTWSFCVLKFTHFYMFWIVNVKESHFWKFIAKEVTLTHRFDLKNDLKSLSHSVLRSRRGAGNNMKHTEFIKIHEICRSFINLYLMPQVLLLPFFRENNQELVEVQSGILFPLQSVACSLPLTVLVC